MSLLEGILLAISAFLGYRLSVHRRNMRRMVHWISGPLDDPIPDARGVWGDFVSSMNQRVKIRQQEKDLVDQALEQFQNALEALPDGVIFMDAQRRILWLNKPATRMMALQPEKDKGKPVEHLVREPEFVAYLQRGDYSEPLMYHPNRRDQVFYKVRVITYGIDRMMLVISDLTQLEKLENVRRDFVANVSHELKTPLTVIGGFIETLQIHHDTLPADKRQRYLDLALSQSHQMGRLVQDLLTLSTLEAPSSRMEESDVPIKPLVAELVTAVEALSAGAHTLHIDIPETLVLHGSASALRSIFGNLINNAVNYTPAGGGITIRWITEESTGIFSVQDTGIGIPAIHLARLSERFYRVDSGRSRETGGTGLGLAIVKHALSRHQGHLKIRSQLNKGSTFDAVFPLERCRIQ